MLSLGVFVLFGIVLRAWEFQVVVVGTTNLSRSLYSRVMTSNSVPNISVDTGNLIMLPTSMTLANVDTVAICYHLLA